VAEIINTQITANADFSGLLSQVKSAITQLSALQKQFSLTDAALTRNIKTANANFSSILSNSGQFSTQFVAVSRDIDKFGKNLDAGRLKLRDYYRTWQEYHRSSNSMVKELARQQIALQQAILQPLGKNARGQMQFAVNIPTGIDELKNKTAIANKELSIMNKVMQDGSLQLINWGKNTQWAGRQLTVGLTVPIAAFGKAAAEAFNQADRELTRLTKVYGGLAATSSQELSKVRDDVSKTAKDLSSAYGVSFKDTIALAADIAATGQQGNDLLKSLQETTRLSVLGEVDRQEAMKATLAIQNAFKQNTTELADSINFLNAVENQTSTTLNDLVDAIPKAGPIIRGLGGSVQDLALYLTAMREGGIDAASAANGLKSALGSLINPTNRAKDMFEGFGIDLEALVTKNAGNLTDTILALQSALDTLNPLQKQQALEQLFGKYQFARMGALFDNLGRQGSQTLQVLDLMKASTQQIGAIADRELAMVTESASGRYRRAIEGLRADLATVGESFLDIATKLINVADKVINFFNKLPEPVKKFLSILGGVTAVTGPIIMLTGVFANFLGYVFKGLSHLRAFFSGAKGFKLLTPDMVAAEAAAESFGQTLYSDAAAATALKSAVDNLRASLAALNQVVPSTITRTSGATGRANIMGESGSVIPESNIAHLLAQARMTPEELEKQTFYASVPFVGGINQGWGTRPQPLGTTGTPMVEGVTALKGASASISTEQYARYQALLTTMATKTKAELENALNVLNMTGRLPTQFLQEFDDILPGIRAIATNAANAAKTIATQAQQGIITAEQAQVQIEAANRALLAELESMAVSRGINVSRLRMVPGTNQQIISRSPSGKVTFNGKSLLRKDRAGRFYGPFSENLGIAGEASGFQYRNKGGQIYQSPSVVPGPNINADVVPAMLTPGEFVVNRKATAENLPLLMAINDNKQAPGSGMNVGGIARILRGIVASRFAGRGRDATSLRYLFGNKYPILTRGNNTGNAIQNYLESLPLNQRSKAAEVIQNYGFNLDRSRARSTKTLEWGHLDSRGELSSILESNGFPRLSYSGTTPTNATHLTKARIVGNKRYVSKYTVDYDERSNKQANQNNLLVSDFIARNLGRYGKYDNLFRMAGVDQSKFAKAEKEIDKQIKKYLSDKDDLLIGDFGGDIQFENFIPFIDEVMISNGAKKSRIKSLKTRNVIRKSNLGGMIPLNNYMGGGGIPGIAASRLAKIMSKWGKVRGVDSSNQDPLHGPLNIGKYMTPVTVRNRAYPAAIQYGPSWNPFRQKSTINVMAGATGSAEERARYAAEMYAKGAYDIMREPSHVAALLAARTKGSGTFFRGISLASSTAMKPLPEWLMNEIKMAKATGNFSKLIGKEFIMRRSSWSSDPQVARGFGDFYLMADVKNRGMTPISKIVPDLEFGTPQGKVAVNEQESYFGGKFRITAADSTGLRIETISGPMSGNRAMGGGVSAGGAYVVGENGPEMFVPNTSGTIIPGVQKYAKAGQVRKKRQGLSGNPAKRAMQEAEFNARQEAAAMAAGEVIPGKTRGYGTRGAGPSDLQVRGSQVTFTPMPDYSMGALTGTSGMGNQLTTTAYTGLLQAANSTKDRIAAINDSIKKSYESSSKAISNAIDKSRAAILKSGESAKLAASKTKDYLAGFKDLSRLRDRPMAAGETFEGPLGTVVQTKTEWKKLLTTRAGFLPPPPAAGSRREALAKRMQNYGKDNGGMLAGMAGMGMMTAGSQMGGAGGTAMMAGGMALSMAPAFLPQLGTALKGMTSMSVVVFKVIRLLKMLSLPGAILTAVVWLGKKFLDMKKHAEEVGKANRASFGLTGEQAKKAGIEIVSLSDRLKSAKDAADAFKASGLAAYNENTKTGFRGLTLSIKELKTAIEDAKKNMPDLVNLFNNIDPSNVNQLAQSMKADFIAGGMSAEEATNKVFAIIKASEKATMAVGAIGNKGFADITDKATAAAAKVRITATEMSSVNSNSEEAATGIMSMVNALLEAEKASIGTKDATGKIVTAQEAVNTQLQTIANTQGANKNLTNEQLLAIQAQNKELGQVLNTSDNLASVYAKSKLLLAGMGDEVSKLDAATAISLAKYQSSVETASASILKTGSFGPLNTAIDNYSKKWSNSSKSIQKAAQSSEEAYKKQADAIQKIIDKINKEADARKKALELQKAERDFKTEISLLDIEYRNAIANGNEEAAASAQIRIQDAARERQEQLALQAIEDERQRKLEEQQAKIDKLNEKKMKQEKEIVAMQQSAANNQQKSSQAQMYMGLISQALTARQLGQIDQKAFMGQMETAIKGVQSLKDKDLNAAVESILGTGVIANTEENRMAARGGGKLTVSTDLQSKIAALGNRASSELSVEAQKNFTQGASDIKAAATDFVTAATIITTGKIPEGATVNGKSVKAVERPEYQSGGKGAYTNRPGVGDVGTGGRPKGSAMGGPIYGPGTGTSDSIPALLSNGEFVVNARATAAVGVPFLNNINRMGMGGYVNPSMSSNMSMPSYRVGGAVYKVPTNRIGYAYGGMVESDSYGATTLNFIFQGELSPYMEDKLKNDIVGIINSNTKLSNIKIGSDRRFKS